MTSANQMAQRHELDGVGPVIKVAFVTRINRDHTRDPPLHGQLDGDAGMRSARSKRADASTGEGWMDFVGRPKPGPRIRPRDSVSERFAINATENVAHTFVPTDILTTSHASTLVEA